GGVLNSRPEQNGQCALPCGTLGWREKSVGRFARSVAMITQRPVIGSLRSSGNDDPPGPLLWTESLLYRSLIARRDGSTREHIPVVRDRGWRREHDVHYVK